MIIKKLLKQYYDIQVQKTYALEGGFRNQCYKVTTADNSYIFIIYKKERGIRDLIKNAHDVAIFLSQKHFPTRIPILTIKGKEYIRDEYEDGVHFCALYNFLSGETIQWEAYTRRHLKSMGKTLSDLHFTLKKFPKHRLQKSKIQRWSDATKKEVTEMKKYLEEVEPWIKRKLKVKLIWSKISNISKSILKQSEGSRKQEGILHYDFVRGNILFSKKIDKKLDIYPITGILDFEKVCMGPFIADIARTLAFLIIDCKYKDEITINKRFLVSGYERRGGNKLPFDVGNNPELEDLLCFFWLRDFWKFLVHNPYEFLYMNEHYIRTRDRLIQRRLMEKVKGDN